MVFNDFGSKFNLQQNGHHLKAPFTLIAMVQIPASYLIPSPRYLAQCIAQTLGQIPNLYNVYPIPNERLMVSKYPNEIGSWKLCHCGQHNNNVTDVCCDILVMIYNTVRLTEDTAVLTSFPGRVAWE